MPPAIIGAGIAAAGALGGAALSARAQGKATKAQAGATSEALAFQKEEARLKREADAQRFAAWNAGREALMRRYGIELPPVSGLATPGSAVAPGRPAPQPVIAMSQQPAPANIRDLIRSEGPPPELGTWSDWARYGLGGPRGA